MAYETRQAQIDWRSFATSAEAAALAKLETEAALIDSRRGEISRKLRIIRDRCLSRSRHQRLKREAASA